MAKILVVEDHAETAETLRIMLESKQHQVMLVANGSDALKFAHQFIPRLIFLDVMLPGIDGYALQQEFLADPDFKNIPVIIMTSKPELKEVFDTAANVKAFIPKPFTVEGILETVNRVLT